MTQSSSQPHTLHIHTFSPTTENSELPPEFFVFDQGAPLQPHHPAVREAGAHLLATDAHGLPVGRLSLWWENIAPLHNAPTGYIGHYAIRLPAHAGQLQEDAPIAHALLQAACAHLRRQGCTWAVGPLDGSTFRAYRFITERRLSGYEHPPFFLEPNQPDPWPGHFTAAGFSPLAHYSSAMGRLPQSDPHLDLLLTRAKKAGATLRPLELDNFESELLAVYEVIRLAFRANFLYTPITPTEFVNQFLPLRPYIRPELASLVEKAGFIIGFLFAVPDYAQAQRGEPIDTIIIKTIGVTPDSGVLGLGNLLTAHCQTIAYALGYRRVIHALMHNDNISTRISRRYAQPIRGYTLYARALR